MWIEYNRFALSDGGRYALNAKNDGALVATESKNCRVAKGMLRSGVGIQEIQNVYGDSLYVPGARAILAITGWQRPEGLDTEFAFITSAGDIYVYSGLDDALKKMNTLHRGYTTLFRDTSDSTGKRMIALCPDGFCLFTRHGRLNEYTGNCTGTGCVFYNRLFFADENIVRFSEVDSYTDFSESVQGGGKVELMGEGPVQKLIVYRDAILVFMRDSAIEFHAKGAADEFFAKPIDYYGHRIVGGTVARCGDNVLFINCVGELYRLHGDSCQRIAENIPPEFYEDGVRAAANGELYFVTGMNGRTLVADLDGECYFLNYILTALTDCAGEAVGVYSGVLRKFVETAELPENKHCSFTVEDWLEKDGRERQIEKIRLYGTGNATVTVKNSGKSVSHSVTLRECGVDVPIALRAKKFKLEIGLGVNSKIWKLDALARDVGGEK